MLININKLRKNRGFFTVCLLLAAATAPLMISYAALSASGEPAENMAGGPSAAMPVKVMTVMKSEAIVWTDYAGRLEAVNYAEVRPQVSGEIKAVKFLDGQEVKKGDVLFVINPAPYEAAAAQAEADLASASSQLDLARKERERAADLLKTDAIAQAVMDQRESAARAAAGAADAAAARLRQAKIDLDYAYVKAPISGRAGRAEITEGNLVQAGPNAPLLTTIVSSGEIYADFDVDEQTYLEHVRGGAQGLAAEQTIPVMLTLKSDEKRRYDGVIHSFDNRINPETGTIRARALFKNDDGALLPGMFVTVKLGGVVNEKKILIPERAVGTDQDRKFVYVVSPENMTVYREVKLGATMNGDRVVEEGLVSGEKIITEGVIRIRPDMPVAPQEEAAEMPAAPAEPSEEILKEIDAGQ